MPRHRQERVEGQLGEEAFPARIARGDLLELHQVGLAGRQVIVDAFEVGLVKAGSSPIWVAYSRSSRAPMAWKVPAQGSAPVSTPATAPPWTDRFAPNAVRMCPN
jgi:hypothetical protein